MTIGTKPLSPPMIAAIDHALAHGGTLVRYGSGFWAEPGAATAFHVPAPFRGGLLQPCITTPTIQALVDRGFAKVTERRARTKVSPRNGTREEMIAVEITIPDGAAETLLPSAALAKAGA